MPPLTTGTPVPALKRNIPAYPYNPRGEEFAIAGDDDKRQETPKGAWAEFLKKKDRRGALASGGCAIAKEEKELELLKHKVKHQEDLLKALKALKKERERKEMEEEGGEEEELTNRVRQRMGRIRGGRGGSSHYATSPLNDG